MSEQDELSEPDLIDRIANALPVEVRADYYRELRHCRSLPENDEMLRILRAMQFSLLLMVQVPERMASERERFEQTVTGSKELLENVGKFTQDHKQQIDRRLEQVSTDVAKALKPEVVAATINESLRQQFIKSTIPETADALAVNAAQIKKATAEFVSSAHTLGGAYGGAVAEARQAIARLESTCTEAVTKTTRAAQELLTVFRQEYRWSLWALTASALLLGFLLGIGYAHWVHLPSRP